jgi:hypothetical protein
MCRLCFAAVGGGEVTTTELPVFDPALIRELDLNDVPLDDGALARVGAARGLERLSLVAEPRGVTDEGLKHLRGLANLGDLHLGNLDITDAGLAHLTGLRSLRRLAIVGARRVTDAGLGHLSKLTGLESLTIEDTSVTADGLARYGLSSRVRRPSPRPLGGPLPMASQARRAGAPHRD